MFYVLLELRASSKLPQINATSTKAPNKLVRFKMWLKWNVLRGKVESNWTTAQARSKLQQVPAWEGKQEKSTTAKQNALMEGKQWLLFLREQRKLSSFIIKQEGRELFRTTSEMSWERTKSLVMEHLPAGGACQWHQVPLRKGDKICEGGFASSPYKLSTG